MLSGEALVLVRVKGNDPSLKSLESLSLDEEFEELVEALVTGHQNTFLEALSISCKSTEVWFLLGKLLKAETSLSELRLDYSSFDTSAWQYANIASGLKENVCVKSLHLDAIQLGDRGAEIVAHCLQSHSSRRKVSLGSNKIGPAGVLLLANALQHNSTLEELSLQGNTFSCDGATAVAKALLTNRMLVKIDLQWCSIGAIGGLALASALETDSCGLQELQLGSNQVKGRGHCQGL
jgi:hypothetical protein